MFISLAGESALVMELAWIYTLYKKNQSSCFFKKMFRIFSKFWGYGKKQFELYEISKYYFEKS